MTSTDLSPLVGRPAELCLPPNLKRDEASRYLASAYGIEMATATLAKLACISTTGPKFFKAGRRALYPRTELDAWATARLGELRSSTSIAGPQE